jgi:hypothetical protein
MTMTITMRITKTPDCPISPRPRWALTALRGLAPVAAALLLVVMALVADLSAQVSDDNGVMNPNLVGAADLAGLVHMTAEIADGVIQRRPFLDMLELNTYLRDVLPADQRSELYVRLFVPIDLNTATDEDILAIPGVGSRMLHEFKEYRPYRAIEQFRREIGKYVDDDEIARLERYVVVRAE